MKEEEELSMVEVEESKDWKGREGKEEAGREVEEEEASVECEVGVCKESEINSFSVSFESETGVEEECLSDCSSSLNTAPLPPPPSYPAPLPPTPSYVAPPAPPSYPAPVPPGFLPPETPVAVSSTGAQFQQVKKPRQQKRTRQPAQSEATKFDPIEDQILLQGEKPRKKKKIKMSARMIEYLDRNKDHIELEDIHSDDLQEEEEEEPDDDPLNLPPLQLGSQAQWNPPSEQLPPPTPSQPRQVPQTSRPRAYEDMQREVSSLPEPLRSEVDKVLDKWFNAVKQLPKGGDASGAWGIIATIFDKYGVNDPALLDLKKHMYISHLELLQELDKEI